MVHTVEAAGYGAASAIETLPVQGMTCASCVSRVEKALRRPPGVLDVNVNLATERATVTYVPGQASRDDLVAAVRGAGYDVDAGTRHPGRAGPGRRGPGRGRARRGVRRAAPQGRRRLRAQRHHLRRHHQPGWFPFLPAWLHNGYLLWGLATVVQFWVGRQFYTTAWSALRHGSTTMNTLIALGSSAAYLYSVASVLFPSFFMHKGLGMPLYFDSASFIITLILFGRLLEARARARRAPPYAPSSACSRAPRVWYARGGKRTCLWPELAGDLVVVRPGEKVPVDGGVVEGALRVDEAC